MFVTACSAPQKAGDQSSSSLRTRMENVLRKYVMEKADWALKQEPITVTTFSSPRSAGGKHDFFSEGDYWWPNPVSTDSPYIQKDGMTNPDNFVAHRHAMSLPHAPWLGT